MRFRFLPVRGALVGGLLAALSGDRRSTKGIAGSRARWRTRAGHPGKPRRSVFFKVGWLRGPLHAACSAMRCGRRQRALCRGRRAFGSGPGRARLTGWQTLLGRCRHPLRLCSWLTCLGEPLGFRCRRANRAGARLLGARLGREFQGRTMRHRSGHGSIDKSRSLAGRSPARDGASGPPVCGRSVPASAGWRPRACWQSGVRPQPSNGAPRGRQAVLALGLPCLWHRRRGAPHRRR